MILSNLSLDESLFIINGEKNFPQANPVEGEMIVWNVVRLNLKPVVFLNVMPCQTRHQQKLR